MSDDLEKFLSEPFHGCALIAYVEVAQETKQVPPDSELVRQLAYKYYEAEMKRIKESKFEPSPAIAHLFNEDGTVREKP